MANSFETFDSAYVVCPFYKGESFARNNALIRCEGPYEGTVSTLSARSQALLQKHKKRYCTSLTGCRECRFYLLADEKYDENGRVKRSRSVRNALADFPQL